MPHKNRSVTALCFVLYLVVGRTVAADLTEQLDVYVQKAISDWKVPGLAIAVVSDDSAFAKGYGVREVGKPDLVDVDTLFQIGSTTKAMTAATVGMLVDDGQLGWDDRVIQHLPEFVLKDPYATRELRIRDLLTHRGGLPNTDYLWQPVTRSRSEIFQLLRDVDPAYSLRAGFVYQNVMYMTAGEVVARVSGTPWEQFVKQRLFDPLGMSRTVLNAAEAREMGNFAVDHRRLDGRTQVIKDRFEGADQTIAPAGMVWSSVRDMSCWMRLLLDEGRTSDREVLSKDVVAELLRPQTVIREEVYPSQRLIRPHWVTYSLGWFQMDYKGRALCFHTGSYAGMAAIVGLVPDESLGVVVLINLDHAEVRHALMLKVFDLFGEDDDNRDWSTDLKKLYEEIAVGRNQRQKELRADRVQATEPTLPLERYAGRYSSELYGDIEIVRLEDGLRIEWGSHLQGTLEHWHYDTFRIHWENRGSTQLFRFVVADGDPARFEQLGGPSWKRERLRR